MNILEERILKEGKVLPGDIVAVGSFLNQQLDPDLLRQVGELFADLFAAEEITKVMTVEASGIAIACFTAEAMHVPAVFAKKSISANVAGDVWQADVFSYTHGKTYTISVPKEFLSQNDKILLIDDFLANGEALKGMVSLCKQAGAQIAGAGICVEKTFQTGGKQLREQGIRIESLVRIASLAEGKIELA